MENVALRDCANYVSEKIEADLITTEQYIATDNILQNKQGITTAIIPPLSGSRVTHFKKGDTLIANIRPYLKKIWLADFDGGCSADVLAIRANEKFNSTFIYYALFRDDFFEHAMKGSKGTKMPRGDKNQILDFSIPNFDLKTQQKIAHTLSLLDRKIALNQAINRKLEAMAKRLYDYWFVQFDFPDSQGKPYQASGGEMCFCKALGRDVPKGWEVKTLGEIETHIVTGKTPSKTNDDFFNGDIPFITIGDIRGNTFVTHTDETLTTQGAETQKTKYLPENSLCVSCIATTGLIGFTTQKSQTNQQINSIIFDKEYNRYFLYFALNDFFANSKAKTGNTFANMNKQDFSSIELLTPNKEILQKYHQTVNAMFMKIKSNAKQTQTLTALRNYLLPLLMNGQIRLAD